MTNPDVSLTSAEPVRESAELSLRDAVRPLAENYRAVLGAAVLCAAAAVGISFLVKPTFTATNTFLLPQQTQTTSLATASSGTLGALANAASGGRNSADQYVAMMESVTVADRLIQKFGLRELYDKSTMLATRGELAKNTRISATKKDGLIKVDFDDVDPARAANVANQYVEELRWLTSHLATTEAQQRRVFFEGLLKVTKDNLSSAQLALEQSGFSGGALNVAPAEAAGSYAKLKAEITLNEVKLQSLRSSLSDEAPEIRTQLATIQALRAQLASVEQKQSIDHDNGNSDYVGKLRDYKYNEILLELYARQYELARADESRDGVLVQVLDSATPPERKSAPRRSIYAAIGGIAGLALASLYFLLVSRRASRVEPTGA